MSNLFKGKKLLKKQADGSLKPVDDPQAHLTGKVVLVYFSAHWCPPCRGFTPLLRSFYEEIGEAKLEVVFVSFDRADEDFQEYVKNDHGNWSVISFDDPFGRELAGKFKVSGIPFAAVIDADGNVLTDARGALQRKDKPASALMDEWKALSKV